MIELSEIRRHVGVTQAQIAARLALTQGNVSQLERRGDILLSTLTDYLAALGATATIVVQVGEQTFEYPLTGGQQ